jgi:hypothetical protein
MFRVVQRIVALLLAQTGEDSVGGQPGRQSGVSGDTSRRRL